LSRGIPRASTGRKTRERRKFYFKGKIMSKNQDSKKTDKKKPAKTMKEKKQAKRDKKADKDGLGILRS
jgi:hypothetical protein